MQKANLFIEHAVSNHGCMSGKEREGGLELGEKGE